MGLLLRWLGILALLSGGGWAGSEGLTARLIPDRVQPGDVFELRVEMDRAEYARFELQVPPQEHLHRVAVEMKPVALEDGRYRQSETWLLQADRSGDLVLEGASVVVTGGEKEQVVKLPPLRLGVMSFAEADTSAEPVGLPSAVPRAGGIKPGLIWGVSVSILSLVAGVIWWIRQLRQPAPTPQEDDRSCVGLVLEDLKAGELPTDLLEWMMAERGAGWSPELRARVAEAVYARRGDPARLAELLEQEGAP